MTVGRRETAAAGVEHPAQAIVLRAVLDARGEPTLDVLDLHVAQAAVEDARAQIPDVSHLLAAQSHPAQGGIVDGIGSTLYGEMTLKNGKVQQSNFGDYRMATLREAPPIESILIDSKERPGSMSEMSTPLMIPALVNALYQATGQRVRELPLVKQGFSI